MLKRILLAAALAATLAPSVAPTAARAQTHTLKRAGAWNAFGGKSSDGTALCGMGTSWDNARYFSVKRFGSEKYLVIQAINPAWNFHGGRVPMRMKMDDNDAWTASGTTESGGNKVEFTVPLSSLKEFLKEFYGADGMALAMGEDGQVRWSIDLSGTQDVATAFSDCLNDME